MSIDDVADNVPERDKKTEKFVKLHCDGWRIKSHDYLGRKVEGILSFCSSCDAAYTRDMQGYIPKPPDKK